LVKRINDSRHDVVLPEKINIIYLSIQIYMKLKLFFLYLLLTQILSAQTFTEVISNPGFVGVRFSSIAFADVDGDNDQDVLITGISNSNQRISKLYINDGLGNFSEWMGTPFDGVGFSSIVFSDVDGDSDPDVLITGLTDLNQRISKLYMNDGLGNFTEMLGTPFDGVVEASIAIADVDMDGDPDILLTGQTMSNENIAKLYLNDGLGNFIELLGTPFDGVWVGSIAFSDVDGDGDPDVLITGDRSQEDLISKLYKNDGQGNFTEVPNTPFDNVAASSVAFSDVDGDNDPDVFITGIEDPSSTERIAKLYTNDGLGNFSEMSGTPFDKVRRSSIAFIDVDGDTDQDLFITGAIYNSGDEQISKLYMNDGLGNFTELSGTPFDGVWLGSIAFTDVDGDNDPDILITGENNLGEGITKLYTNDLLSSTNNITPGFNFDLIMYPNPIASNHLKVNFKVTENSFVNVKVYNLNGQLLSEQKEFMLVGTQTIIVNIDALTSGSYFIEISNGRNKGNGKFIVP